MVEQRSPKPRAEGSSPSAPATSSQALYRLRRFSFIRYENRRCAHAAAPPFRKRSRSAHLFACKRAHHGALSLPTFCGIRCGISGLFASLSACGARSNLCDLKLQMSVKPVSGGNDSDRFRPLQHQNSIKKHQRIGGYSTKSLVMENCLLCYIDN